MRALIFLVVIAVISSSVNTFAQRTQVDRSQSAEQSNRTTGSRQVEHPFARVQQRIIELTNEFREEQGRRPLEPDDRLMHAAQDLAEYMALTDRYSHTADGRQPSERVTDQDYEYCLVAENIGYQFSSRGFEAERLAQRLVDGWIESPEHRENMLNAHMTEIGAGVAQSEKSGYYYGVQVFARPKSAAIEFRVQNRTSETVEYTLGDRSYELPPRYTRMHTECIPPRLAVHQPEGDPKAIRTQEGITYVVRNQDEGQLEVVRRDSSDRSAR